MEAILERPNYECLLFGVFPAFKNPEKLLLHLFLHLVVQSNNDVFCISFSDLDDTLYPFSAGINLACRKNIQGG